MNESISARVTRLNNLIIGHTKGTSKVDKSVVECLSREGLLDAFCLLYNECNKENLKKKDKNIAEFINKYRDVILETKSLRVNANDFTIKSLIGKGYFGDVYLASEKITNDIYAVKKIRKSVTITSAQIKEERDIMAANNSEWITSLQYAFQDHDYLYLVMEYVPGGDLLSLMIRNGSFDEDLSKFFLAEMTLALNALHGMGYVHRDIKPENILLDRFGHLKLADFGNATHMNKDGIVVSMSPVGTPDYIAPELLQTLSSTTTSSKSIHGVSCDYWSMGIIGYEFITETTPFHDDNVNETYTKIMAHCENGKTHSKLEYPTGISVSKEFRHLIDHLVTKPSKRLTYEQLIQHPFFKDIDWLNLRQLVPPIIPTLSGEDDTSNFEDVDKKCRRSTFTKIQAKGFANRNDFSGQNLPFLGYSFVHNNSDDELSSSASIDMPDSNNGDDAPKRLALMQRTIDEQTADIKTLQHKLLEAQRRNVQTESLEKILLEAKNELDAMKDRLKEKTIELAACRTDIKTLRSSLKIEEEQRLKSDENIAQVLNQTYQKWEKAKKLSEQNYEKQIAEKKTEIGGLAQNLQVRENELAAKVDECRHLQERVENYKEMLRTAKEQNGNDKNEFDANKKQIIDAYEMKLIELKNKLKQEKETRVKQTDELRKSRQAAECDAQSMQNLSEEKMSIQRNIDDMKQRLTRQIEENKELRQNAANFERKYNELTQKYEELMRQQEEYSSLIVSRRSSVCNSEVYRSAIGSLENLPSSVENQLRNDLQAAKENENMQRDRADRLEKVVTRLEEAMDKFHSKPVEDLLERQNEKLEDKLTAIREQAIVDRQASRAAHLSLWKLEKQLDELNIEKKSFVRRLELADEKFRKLREEKEQLERAILDNHNVIQLKEDKIECLHAEMRQLKNDLNKEHAMWECAELERMKEKSEIVEHVSKIHRLESIVDEQKRKLYAVEKRNDELALENKRLAHEKSDELTELNAARDTIAELHAQLDVTQRNYTMLKEACTIMEEQLTELEQMYEKEVRKNRESCEKNDTLWTNVRDKDETIKKLRQDLNELLSHKIEAETKCTQLQIDIQQITENLDIEHNQMIEQQQKLIEKTTALYEAQEKIEVLSLDITNLQRINTNYERELHILKEENAKILTDLFIAKEESNNLTMKGRECRKEISDLKREIEQLNGTMAEQKNYFVQRDIKSEATVHQYKKLISYLQQRVEELSQKKKKTFGLFSSGSNAAQKKENIPPIMSQANVETLKKMEDDLRRERARCNQLTEQLLKAKTDMRTSSNAEQQFVEKAVIDVPVQSLDEMPAKSTNHKRRSYQTHRFEMTLDNKDPNTDYTRCIACRKQVMINHSYWKCKECNVSVHRRCRSDVKTSCGGDDIDIDTDTVHPSAPPAESPIPIENKFVTTSTDATDQYQGDIVLNTTDFTTQPLKVNCIFEINENTFLMGCDTGLYSYHQHNKSLVHIDGVTGVKFIAATINVQQSKCIIIGDNGENLYQCDLRHLQNRAQAGECLKPNLDTILLELPFANRLSNERWHYAALHCRNNDNETFTDALIIACTTCRIVVLRFDMKLGRFKPMCALDTAMPVNSILFTRHSAIVCSDKFFEIDLNSLAAEEFLNESDPSIVSTRNCRPMAAFQINQQEFLLCFEEFGLFVDEYGSRSRPNDINWLNPPIDFRYRDPLLFVSYRNMIQVMRINKSYTNEQVMQQQIDTGGGGEDDIRAFINCNEPIMMGDCEKLGIFVTVDGTTIMIVNGVKALKSHLSYSLETLFSSMASIPKALRMSSDTISTMDNNSSSS